MKTNYHGWRRFFSAVTFSVVLCSTSVTAFADHTKATNKEKIEMPLSAGAAVLLDMDVAIADEEIVEIVKNNTNRNVSAKTLTKQESTLVMANVNEYVNIRKEANQDSEKLGVLYKDCGGHIVERQGEWTKIQSGDVTGWVRDKYLHFGDEAKQLAEEVGMLVAYAQTDTLRVRKEASMDGGVLGLLSKGEALEAIKEHGDWVEVSYER